jgi:hypothetical protein
MLDLAIGREQRREKKGYATPAEARAFLQMARRFSLAPGPAPPRNPLAQAYFRAIEPMTAVDASSESLGLPASPDSPAPEDAADAVAAVVEVLVEAGVIEEPPRALLDRPKGDAPRLAGIRAQMQRVHGWDHAAYSTRSEELAFLANTIVAGCSIQARPFTAKEASDAAIAVCNLGLENWPHPLPEDLLIHQDLVSVFQVGWTVLHGDVCMYAAEQLIAVLKVFRCDDRETQSGLDALRIEMTTQWRAGAPWRARDALDVITSLDMPAWAALLGLIDECPVLHAGVAAAQDPRVRAVSANAFDFISENSQIAAVREFMRSLPNTLRP